MHGRPHCGSQSQGEKDLPEVRAGLVLVRPKSNSYLDDVDADAAGDRSSACRWSRRGRLRTWLLPLMRVFALAASTLCLTPTRGMGTSLTMMDVWGGGGMEASEDRRSSYGGQRQEHVVFVGVPEESAILPLKALAQEMIARGYRASLALPLSFQNWVEDIPGLAFIQLQHTTTTSSLGKNDPSSHSLDRTTSSSEPSTYTGSPNAEPSVTTQDLASTKRSSCSARHADRHGRNAYPGKVLGDAWGGGVGGGWGAGLGLWRGLRGSILGARELLGHFTAYLSFYHRQEAAMYSPLVEALRRDPPALVVADRRALAAFRACSELGLRCVVNSAGLLGDLDRPPNSIPAPYTGFPMESRTIGQRLHSSLVRLILALSRLQAAQDADDLAAWRDYDDPLLFRAGRGYVSDEVMTLGNSCFGSLEYPRTLPPRVHMVGPLWIRGQEGEGETGDENPASPQACQDVSALSGETLDARSCRAGRGAASARDGSVGDDSAGGARDTRKKGLEDVWAWLEPEAVEGDDDGPVVVVSLGRGGGKAWGVPPDAAVGGVDGRPTWNAFREETVTQLSAVGCRTLWLRGSEQDDVEEPEDEEGETSSASNSPLSHHHHHHQHLHHRRDHYHHPVGESDHLNVEVNVPPLDPHRPPASDDHASDNGRSRDDPPLGEGASGGGEERRGGGEGVEGGGHASVVFQVDDARAGGRGSSELLLRVMSHRSVTVLVTDGDLRSVQTALWHGKPLVVLPTALDERETASRLAHLGAGVTCRPPCEPPELVAAVVDAHNVEKRRAALRARVVLCEAGGVTRAANLLENELHTHLAAIARRNGFPCDHPANAPLASDPPRADNVPCWSRERRAERRKNRNEDPSEEWEELPEAVHGTVPGIDDLDLGHPEDATWYPDDPDWISREMSWAQRHLVDVYAVYGALVMGVGLLMKLTWNLVWSLCDISTAPAYARSNGRAADNPHPPSPGPAKESATNGTSGTAGGKPSRGGSGKGWGGSSGVGVGGSGGGAGKHSKGGGGKVHHGNGSTSVHHGAGTTASGGGGSGAGDGGGGFRTSSSKKITTLTNGHGHSR